MCRTNKAVLNVGVWMNARQLDRTPQSAVCNRMASPAVAASVWRNEDRGAKPRFCATQTVVRVRACQCHRSPRETDRLPVELSAIARHSATRAGPRSETARPRYAARPRPVTSRHRRMRSREGDCVRHFARGAGPAPTASPSARGDTLRGFGCRRPLVAPGPVACRCCCLLRLLYRRLVYRFHLSLAPPILAGPTGPRGARGLRRCVLRLSGLRRAHSRRTSTSDCQSFPPHTMRHDSPKASAR